jgi:hypothetical protein
MFFFGLLSTNLPYIVLAVLYLISFAGFSLKALEQEALSNADLNPKVILAQTDQNSNHSYFNYSDYIADQEVSDLPENSPGNPPLQKQKCSESCTTFSLFNHLITYSLFSRPPPVLV